MTTPRLTVMNPVLAVDDLDEALAYYRDSLGFETTWIWGEPPVRAGVARDGLELQLAGGGTGPGGPSVVYFHVTAVDALFEQCKQGGARIETEIGERPFHVRDFRVLDPSGNKLGFGEPRPLGAAPGPIGARPEAVARRHGRLLG